MGKADITSKWLLGEDPDAWVRWILADPTLKIETFLSAEFQHVLRHSDALLQVQGDDGPFLLLIELQLHYDPDMPWRMQAYAALAEEKYRLPAYPLVFYLLPPASGVALPEQYYREFRGLVARRDFRVVKAWELDAQAVLAEGPLVLVPLTPLMRGAGEETLRAGVQKLREGAAGAEMESLLGLFASLVMDPEQIRQIVRWEMAVLRESPWYQEIVQEGFQEGLQKGRQEGLQKGRQEGLQEGRQEGRQEELVKGVLSVLQSRFELPSSVVERLTRQLQKVEDVETLRRLLVAAATAEDLEHFQATLERSDGFAEAEDQSEDPAPHDGSK